MHPDELEPRRCRKEKIAMEKLPKSRCCKGRCCKVDAVKVKGLPGGVLFDIGVYRFSDHAGSLFMSWGQTRLLADYDTVYLHLKEKLLKIGKGLSEESKDLLKIDSWPVANRGLTRLHHAFLLAYLFDYCLFFSPSANLPTDHRPIALTNWPAVRAEPLRPSANLVDHSSLPSIGRLHFVFHRLLLLIPFDLFFQKMVSTNTYF
jgi:hypothetical protein